MSTTINAKTLRKELERVVRQARQGQRFTVLYRSRVAFDIVPPSTVARSEGAGVRDALYRAGPVGSSSDGQAAATHDRALYA